MVTCSRPRKLQPALKWIASYLGDGQIRFSNPRGAMLATRMPRRPSVSTKYGGVKNVTEGLLPLLRPSPAGARIVNVGAKLALYERLRSETLKKTFRDEDKYTKELMDSLAAKYLEDVKTGRLDEEGSIADEKTAVPMYSESKMFMNGYAIALAKSLSKSQAEDHQILVTTFCPGITETDMLHRALKDGFEAPEGLSAKSVANGADTGLWLALLPKEELAQKNGKFFGEREEYQIGWKNPPKILALAK